MSSISTWRDEIIKKVIRQISYRSNLSNADIDKLLPVLYDYLNEGVAILRKWRKISDENEIYNGKYDDGLIAFLKAKEQINGREAFSDYTSGGVTANMKVTPENILKGYYRQVL